MFYDGKYFCVSPETYDEVYSLRRAGFRKKKGDSLWRARFVSQAVRYKKFPREIINEVYEQYEEAIKRNREGTKYDDTDEYAYQQRGVDAMKKLMFDEKGNPFLFSSAYLADDMGIGKTKQLIMLREQTGLHRTLVVCPATAKYNWRDQLQQWGKERDICVVEGRAAVFPSDATIVIINFDICAFYAEELREKEWDLVILDEAQYQKNKKSARARAIYGGRTPQGNVLSPVPAKCRVAASGTPVLSRPEELYSTLHYLDPIAWPDYGRFVARYCGAYRDAFGRLNTKGASNLEELHDRLAATILVRRRKRQEVAFTGLSTKHLLPPTIVRPEADEHFLDIQERTADILWRMGINPEESVTEESYDRIVRAFNKDPKCPVPFDEISRVYAETGVAKIPHAVSYIKEKLSERDKLLVFAHHREVIRSIAEAFPNTLVINGAVSAKKRFDRQKLFQDDPEYRLMVAEIRAGGVALTLTAASMVAFIEGSWVPADMQQAADRIDRVTQKEPNIYVSSLIAEGTLDPYMMFVRNRKNKIVKKILDGNL